MMLHSRQGFLYQPTFIFPVGSIFAGGKEGVWYDPSDLSTLYQDSTGLTPVTKPAGRSD